MTQERNSEMDLLLRKLGRAAGSVPQSTGNGSAASAGEHHLDADELSAYAENSLPPTTRARYTEHVADCARCRKIVAQLNLAAGLVVHEPPTTQPAPSGLIAFLTGLFSPMVLRYAIPALALVLIASIGFFVFRSPGSMELAENRTLKTENSAPAEIAQAPQSKTVPVDDTAEESKNKVQRGVVGSRATGAESQPEVKQETRVLGGADSQGKVSAGRQEPVTTDQVAAASPPAPARKASVDTPKPVASDDKREAKEEVAQRNQPVADYQTEIARSNEKVAIETKTPPPKEGPSTGSGLGIASAGVAKSKPDTAAKRGRAEEDESEKKARDRSDKDEPVTVSVSGRRFRKQGSVWIDVAYGSQATMSVTRGSESYRALVADEPGIRTIADQLSGEVIVVWKGKAYRIR